MDPYRFERVLGALLFFQYTSKMFELLEKRLFSYADDSILLAVVHKSVDRPVVPSLFNMDMARIHECANKTKTSVVPISRSVNPPNSDLVVFLIGGFIRMH